MKTVPISTLRQRVADVIDEVQASEERVNVVGQSRRGRLLHVTVTHRGTVIRIISARRATARERHDYEED